MFWEDQDTAGKTLYIIGKLSKDTSLLKSETNQETLQIWQNKMLYFIMFIKKKTLPTGVVFSDIQIYFKR